MPLSLHGVKVYYLHGYKLIPNVFHREMELKVKVEYHTFKIWGNTGTVENHLLCNDLLFPERFWEPINSKFNIHFPKQW